MERVAVELFPVRVHGRHDPALVLLEPFCELRLLVGDLPEIPGVGLGPLDLGQAPILLPVQRPRDVLPL